MSLRIFGKNIESFTLGRIGDDEYYADTANTGSEKSLNFKIPGLDLKSSQNFITNKHQTIEFGLSNEEVDAGQSFVPYFDGSDTSLDVKSPIAGLGFLHYTNNEDFAGFVKPYTITLNYDDFIFKVENDDPTLEALVGSSNRVNVLMPSILITILLINFMI